MTRPKRPYKPSNRKMLTAWIDVELFAAVRAVAGHIGVPVSTVVHDALEAWLKHQQAKVRMAAVRANRGGNALQPSSLAEPPTSKTDAA